MQRPEWTFDGAEEITNNIFALHADLSYGQNYGIIGHPWVQSYRDTFESFFTFALPTWQSSKHSLYRKTPNAPNTFNALYTVA